MKTRFKKGAKIFDIMVTAVAGMLSVGATVLLRDILFPPPLAYYGLHLSCLTLSIQSPAYDKDLDIFKTF